MLRIEGFFLYQIFLESITSLKSLITRMHHFSTEIFFLKMFHIKHFIHNTVHRHTDALRGGVPGAPRSEIENGDNTVEVVIHNYPWEALGIINDPVRPEREVGTSGLSGASWLYN